MSELVCLQCGKEMEYDWAPCPYCGWKAPNTWEEAEEDESEKSPRPMVLDKPRPWIQWTARTLLAAALIGFLFWFFHR